MTLLLLEWVLRANRVVLAVAVILDVDSNIVRLVVRRHLDLQIELAILLRETVTLEPDRNGRVGGLAGLAFFEALFRLGLH